MEEEEPLPFTAAESYPLEGVNINSSFASQSTSYASQDSCKSGQLCSSDSGQQHSSDSLQSSTGSNILAGMRSSVNNKPTVPGNKPALRTRPHSVHGGIPGEASYARGSIVTQITDQDGYRTTRVPISETQNSSGRNFNDSFKISDEKMVDFSSNSYDANVKYSTLNSTQNYNGRFQAIQDGNVNINNKNESIIRSQSLQRSNSSARYSYSNVNANSNGVLVKNLMNQSGHVGDMVAKLNGHPSLGVSNGLSPVTSPNGNTSHLSSHKPGEFVMTNQCDSNIDHNKSREEVSTEL